MSKSLEHVINNTTKILDIDYTRMNKHGLITFEDGKINDGPIDGMTFDAIYPITEPYYVYVNKFKYITSPGQLPRCEGPIVKIGRPEITIIQNFIMDMGLVGLSKPLMQKFIEATLLDISKTICASLSDSYKFLDKRIKKAYKYNRKGMTLILSSSPDNLKVPLLEGLVINYQLSDKIRHKQVGMIVGSITDFYPVNVSNICTMLQKVNTMVSTLQLDINATVYEEFVSDMLYMIKRVVLHTLTTTLHSGMRPGGFYKGIPNYDHMHTLMDRSRLDKKKQRVKK